MNAAAAASAVSGGSSSSSSSSSVISSSSPVQSVAFEGGIPLPSVLRLPVLAHVKQYFVSDLKWTGESNTTSPLSLLTSLPRFLPSSSLPRVDFSGYADSVRRMMRSVPHLFSQPQREWWNVAFDRGEDSVVVLESQPPRGQIGQRGRIGSTEVRVLQALPSYASSFQHQVELERSSWHERLELEPHVAVTVAPAMRVAVPHPRNKITPSTFSSSS